MRFEANTLKEAIRLTTEDYRQKGKVGFPEKTTPARSIRRTFEDVRAGEPIPGTGGSGYTNIKAAISGAAAEMIHRAQARYGEDMAAIRRGVTRYIPEVAAAILVDSIENFHTSNARFHYDHLIAGTSRGHAGDFDMDIRGPLVALVHAHWHDNTSSGTDNRVKAAFLRQVENRRDSQGRHVGIVFYILSINHGLTPY